VQKRILHIFYFHIISLICTVFKLCCPAHLFPNTPRSSAYSHPTVYLWPAARLLVANNSFPSHQTQRPSQSSLYLAINSLIKRVLKYEVESYE
jgi:hypothetical protein